MKNKTHPDDIILIVACIVLITGFYLAEDTKPPIITHSTITIKEASEICPEIKELITEQNQEELIKAINNCEQLTEEDKKTTIASIRSVS